jgi:hypothetical protein
MEGGWLLVVGVALKRAFDRGSERPAGSIRARGGMGGPFSSQTRLWRRLSLGSCP